MDCASSRIDQSSASHDSLSFQRRMSDSTPGFEKESALGSIVIDCDLLVLEYPRSHSKFTDPFVTVILLVHPNWFLSSSSRSACSLATSFSPTAKSVD